MIKKTNPKKLIIIIISAALFFSVFSAFANADLGPKPSVRIKLNGLGNAKCYGTLLSKVESSGPASVWDGKVEHIDDCGFGREIFKAFVDYKDADGFFFLQRIWQVDETKELAWTYYPPSEFKILLYYPETKTFLASGIFKKYAFDSYYTADIDNLAIGSVERTEEASDSETAPNRHNDETSVSETILVEYNEEMSGDERIKAYRSYNYCREIFSLVVRIVLTVVIEMAIALIFGYKEKKQLLLLIEVNGATQILLNVLLNIINYNSGRSAFIVCYILLEFVVFAVEAAVFYVFLNRLSIREKPKRLAVVYAFAANAVSFAAGLFFSLAAPALF